MTQFLPPTDGSQTPEGPKRNTDGGKSEATLLANALIQWANTMEAKPATLEAAMHKVLAKILVDRMGEKPQILEVHRIVERTHVDLVHEINEAAFRKWDDKRSRK